MGDSMPRHVRPRSRNGWYRTVAVAGIAAVVLVGTAGVASARVGISDATVNDASTVATFTFDGGCNGSATVGMSVQLPPKASLTAASLPDGWELQGTDTSAAATSGAEVSLAGTPIPDGTTGGFALTLAGYDTAIDHLVPVLQRCEQGEVAWVDEDSSAAYPAPLLAATSSTATTAASSGEDGQPTTTASVAVTTDFVAESSDSGFTWVTVITGFIVGAAAAAIAGVIVRRRQARAN